MVSLGGVVESVLLLAGVVVAEESVAAGVEVSLEVVVGVVEGSAVVEVEVVVSVGVSAASVESWRLRAILFFNGCTLDSKSEIENSIFVSPNRCS